jgi:hypothetical protein
MKTITLLLTLIALQQLAAQNVGIGLVNPSDKLHINSGVGEDAFRVQVNSSTKLRVWNNGGTSIGSLTTPPANGLVVQGTIQPLNNISAVNKIIIESTADSVVINAGGSQLIVAANGDIVIRSGGGRKIDIDADGNLNLTGNNITIQASGTLNLNGAQVRLNGGTRPVARIADAVSVTGSSGVISSASATVFTQ